MAVIALVPLLHISGEERADPFATLAGRPLCDWTIRAALDSKAFARTVALVADEDAATLARSRKADAIVLDEMPATMDEALVMAAERIADADAFALLDPACPLLHPEDIAGAVGKLKGRIDSVVTAARHRLLLWEADGTPVNYDPQHRPGPREHDGELAEVGTLYVFKRPVIDDTDTRLGGNIAVHEIAAERALRVERDADLDMASFAARRVGYRPPGRRIRLIGLDVDGVLTDQCFYYDTATEVMKKFNTRDGMGLRNAMDAGTEVCLITGEGTGFTKARAAKLGIKRVDLACGDKYAALDAHRRELGLDWDEIAYMGDDWPDLPCIRAAGVGACPRDAEPEVRAAADYVSPVDGGRGCVRDFVRHLTALGRLEVKRS